VSYLALLILDCHLGCHAHCRCDWWIQSR